MIRSSFLAYHIRAVYALLTAKGINRPLLCRAPASRRRMAAAQPGVPNWFPGWAVTRTTAAAIPTFDARATMTRCLKRLRVRRIQKVNRRD